MNIVYLKYAVAVAKAGSLSKAAEELNIAQPNLSKAIKEFEKELDTTIFERKPKGITLTADGERLISYGRKLLKEIDDVEKEFKEKGNAKIVFSISVPRASYISYAFSEFTKTLPKDERYEIYYKETNALRAITNIVEKDYKLGIIRYSATHDSEVKETLESKNLNYSLITEFHYLLLMSEHSALANKKVITYDDLRANIEVAHADPYVPSVSLSEIKKEELPDDINRRIFVFERGSEFDVLSKNEEAYMWVSPIPDDIKAKYNLVERSCPENSKKYRDMLIYPKNYVLSKTDKAFITALCDAKRKFFKN